MSVTLGDDSAAQSSFDSQAPSEYFQSLVMSNARDNRYVRLAAGSGLIPATH